MVEVDFACGCLSAFQFLALYGSLKPWLILKKRRALRVALWRLRRIVVRRETRRKSETEATTANGDGDGDDGGSLLLVADAKPCFLCE